MKYVYKIVAAILALAAIPIALFSKILFFKATSTALQAIYLLGNIIKNDKLKEILSQNGGTAPEFIADSYSVYDLIALFGQTSSDTTLNESIETIIMPIITFAVIFIIVLICAVVTAVFALAAKNNRKVIYSSIAGLTFSLMLQYAFEAISAPILNGELSLATITGSNWAPLIADIETLSLDTPYWFIPLTFIAIIVWTILYNVTLPEKDKKERKLMLGEADD